MIYNNYPDDYIVINAKWIEWDNDSECWCFMTEDAFEKAQSLADYTKQVINNTFDKINSEYAKRLSAFMGTKISVSTAISKLDEVLDQLQGESK